MPQETQNTVVTEVTEKDLRPMLNPKFVDAPNPEKLKEFLDELTALLEQKTNMKMTSNGTCKLYFQDQVILECTNSNSPDGNISNMAGVIRDALNLYHDHQKKYNNTQILTVISF